LQQALRAVKRYKESPGIIIVLSSAATTFISPSAMASRQIVIIGASFGGIPAAHGLLKDILPPLTASGEQTYKVILISPSAEFYWKIGAPRAIVNPKALPTEKVLVPIADGFKSYPKEKFEFIQAYVTSIEPAAQTLQTSLSTSIHYDFLVIASGTSFTSPLWHVSNGSEPLAAALKDIHERLPNASSVLVVGGGPAGVETAGELGETYGGKKDITIISGTDRLLPRLKNPNIGRDAEQRLSKMGVKVINGGVKVTSTTTEGGKTVAKLSNGNEMVVDVYIEATGDKPNNKFIPEAWLNAQGYVKTDPHTLRLDVEINNVYGFGSVASYSDGSVLDTKFALKSLLESIRLDLLRQGETSPSSITSVDSTPAGWISWLTSWIPFFGTAEPSKRKIVYKKITSDLQFVPIGSTQGVGVVFGYKVPSMVVKMAKSKDFMIGNVPKLIEGTQ
jgi:NADH dehydrogenase FAD-containing subunit